MDTLQIETSTIAHTFSELQVDARNIRDKLLANKNTTIVIDETIHIIDSLLQLTKGDYNKNCLSSLGLMRTMRLFLGGYDTKIDTLLQGMYGSLFCDKNMTETLRLIESLHRVNVKIKSILKI